MTREDTERFLACVRENDLLTVRERQGIGMQQEKLVHAVLKDYFCPDRACQEVKLFGCIADCFDGERVTEVQTSGFYRMRDKLDRFLSAYPVTIVHPIASVKHITWIDPETGELGRRSRSPVPGTIYDAVRELGGIRPFLGTKGLTIRLVLLDIEEYRVKDGWDRSGKRGSHRFDRVPSALLGETVLTDAASYSVFLPKDLPETFTSADVQNLSGCRRRNVSYSYLLSILTGLGVTEKLPEKRGRAFLYQRGRYARRNG